MASQVPGYTVAEFQVALLLIGNMIGKAMGAPVTGNASEDALAAASFARDFAEKVGINTRLMRWTAFVVAGSFAGIAGALFGMLHRGMFVESAFWTQSATVLIMTLLGGMFSFFGPAIGAATLFILQRLTNEYTEYWPTVLGVILIVILLFLPEGLAGLVNKFTKRSAARD